MDNQIENRFTEESIGDIDERGHLALALFIGVILVLLVLIYALAQAA